MVEQTADATVNMAVENVEQMVASEGGSFASVILSGDTLKVEYIPGVNEECPECVPTHDSVRRFLELAMKVHCPQITTVEVT